MLAVITYDIPHRKTQDLLSQLILNGYSNIKLIVIPFTKRKSFKPIFKHRPNKCVNISTDELCQRLGITYIKVEINDLSNHFDEVSYKHILIAGAEILPGKLAKERKIINAHPGYLPNVKGLDAFKWAVYNGQPIGVTTHYISEKTDEGVAIEKRIIPIYFEDTFHSVAYRIYETEIEMLVNSIRLIEENKAILENLNNKTYISNKRISHHKERIMISRFNDMRKISNSHRKD